MVAIPVLPAKVPAANPQQILLRAVGKRRRAAHLLPEVVRVRIDADRVDVYREDVAVLDDVVRVAGGNGDPVRLELHADRRARRRRVGEEQADRRLHRFALAPAIMWSSRTKSVPGSSVHALSAASITGTLPGVQPYVVDLTAVHRRESGTRLGTIEHARHASEIDRQIRVVQHLRAIGAELDGAHVARCVVIGTGTTKLRKTSRLPGCSTYGSGSVSTRSGVPSCHPPEKVGGFGTSAGFPLEARRSRPTSR